ncbi:Alb1-domain-containing protein [Biscogniauxia sp. FL1348]|nr:Alb1-domain-containing protein [Biscogniauxia sp. FL1348]
MIYGISAWNLHGTPSVAPSARSRAARRATSPSIDTDKSLKNVQPPPESVDHRPSILAIHHGAGVSRKYKKGRNMSSKARRRHEKEQDRAVAIMERTQQKVAKSKGQARNIHSRAKAWDEINKQIPAAARKSTEENSDEEEDQEESELDDEMNEAPEAKQAGGTTSATTTTAATAIATTGTVPIPLEMDEDHDGIL